MPLELQIATMIARDQQGRLEATFADADLSRLIPVLLRRAIADKQINASDPRVPAALSGVLQDRT